MAKIFNCSTLYDPRVKWTSGIFSMVDEEGEAFLPVLEAAKKATGTTGSQSEQIRGGHHNSCDVI